MNQARKQLIIICDKASDNSGMKSSSAFLSLFSKKILYMMEKLNVAHKRKMVRNANSPEEQHYAIMESRVARSEAQKGTRF